MVFFLRIKNNKSLVNQDNQYSHNCIDIDFYLTTHLIQIIDYQL
jgi:hypothetical protein